MTAERTAWLNGWPRRGRSVLMGTSYHCVGCGLFLGLGCVAFREGQTFPDKDPDWPFDEATCPVHDRTPEQKAKEADLNTWPPRVAELYWKLKLAEDEVARLRAER